MPNALRTLWIRRNLALSVLLMSLLTGALILSFQPLRYKATARLDFRTNAYLITEKTDILADIPPLDTTALIQEARGILSDDVLLRLLSNLKIDVHPEYNPDLEKKKLIPTLIKKLWPQDIPITSREAQLIARARESIEITFTPAQSQIHISVISRSQWLCSALANALAQTISQHKLSSGDARILENAPSNPKPDFAGAKKMFHFSAGIGIVLGIFSVFVIRPPRRKT